MFRKNARVFSGPCSHHSFLIDDKGKTRAVGNNERGQLGLGDRYHRQYPEELPFFNEMLIKEIACALQHTVVLIEGGNVYVFGSNIHGQLGIGSARQERTTPRLLEYFRRNQAETGEIVVRIKCGDDSSYFVSSLGHLFAVGRNHKGQLGVGYGNDVALPLPVRLLDDTDVFVVSVSAGSAHTACLSKSGDLFTWGSNKWGQLGRAGDRRRPKQVFVPGGKVTGVECGCNHTIAATENGEVFAWGNNLYGQLGIGKRSDLISEPARIPFFSRINPDRLTVRVGGHHCICLCKAADNNGDDALRTRDQSRRLYFSGFNPTPELNLGDNNNIPTPAEVDLSSFFQDNGCSIEDVVCGRDHELILTDNGNCYSCGVFGSFQGISSDGVPSLIMVGVGFEKYSYAINERLISYIIQEQELDEYQRTTDSSIIAVQPDGEETVLYVNNRFILARFGSSSDRIVLSDHNFESKLSQEEILRWIYGGFYPNGDWTYDKTVKIVMKILFEEKVDHGDTIFTSSAVKGGGSTHYAHKFVLVAMREYFRAMFQGSWIEAQTNKVDLAMPLNFPFEIYLRFLYTGDMKIENPEDANSILSYIDYFDEGSREDEWASRYCSRIVRKR